jgi:hypothetical protein
MHQRNDATGMTRIERLGIICFGLGRLKIGVQFRPNSLQISRRSHSSYNKAARFGQYRIHFIWRRIHCAAWYFGTTTHILLPATSAHRAFANCANLVLADAEGW